MLLFDGENFDAPFKFTTVRFENGWETYQTFRQGPSDSLYLADFLPISGKIRICLTSLGLFLAKFTLL